jgi:hypothetical protein
MPYTEAQKRATYKWKAKNLEYVNEKRKAYNQTYCEKNREMYKSSSLKYYYLKKEMAIFRNILL